MEGGGRGARPRKAEPGAIAAAAIREVRIIFTFAPVRLALPPRRITRLPVESLKLDTSDRFTMQYEPQRNHSRPSGLAKPWRATSHSSAGMVSATRCWCQPIPACHAPPRFARADA